MKPLVERHLKTLLEEGREEELSTMLEQMHPADVAEILNPLDMEDTIRVMALMDIEQASDVLVEMSAGSREQVAAEIPLEKLCEMVAEMDSDDAADIVAELPNEDANKVLASIEEKDSVGLRRLMMYDEETAGGLMQVELFTADEEETVAEVVGRLRKLDEDKQPHLSHIFVVDEAGVCRGQVSMRQLLLAWPDQQMSELRQRPPLVVAVDEDQEQVAKDFQKYDVQVAPVVDTHGCLLGQITSDDIMDVVHEEVDQDFYRLAGSSEEEVYSSGSFKITALRLPWLLFNLGGGFVTSAVLAFFEASFLNILILIPFVPMVMGLSGAVGSQAATITVRGLAVGRIDRVRPNLFKEIRVSALLAAVLGTIITIGIGFVNSAAHLGLAVGLSTMVAITVSTVLGALIPVFFKALNIDPALASGPVVTSSNDVVSLIIYLVMGTSILTWPLSF